MTNYRMLTTVSILNMVSTNLLKIYQLEDLLASLVLSSLKSAEITVIPLSLIDFILSTLTPRYLQSSIHPVNIQYIQLSYQRDYFIHPAMAYIAL